jgi:hypothetical protein
VNDTRNGSSVGAAGNSHRNFRPGSDTGDGFDAEGHEMSTNRSRRIDRDTAERLLGGPAVGTTADHDALVGLLAAAAAPAAEGELPGEQAALAAFRAARLAPVPVPTSRKRSMLTSAPSKLLSAKVAATVLVTALGGVAVAAGTGNLPTALGGSPAPHGRGPSSVPSASASPRASLGTAPGSSSVVPADLAELCRTLARVGGPARSGASADPRFAPLVRAAGGVSRVSGYCAPVLTGHGDSTGSPLSAQPTGSAAATKPGKSGQSHGPGSNGGSDGHRGATPSSHRTDPPSPAPHPTRKSDPSPHPRA